MDSLILPFRRGKKKDEKKQAVKERIGNELALKHKAQSKIREADIEFEKAFAEVMGLSEKEKPVKKPFSEPKKVVIVGKKQEKSKEEKKKNREQNTKEEEKKKEIRKLLRRGKQKLAKKVSKTQKPKKAKPQITKKNKKVKKKTVTLKEKKQEAKAGKAAPQEKNIKREKQEIKQEEKTSKPNDKKQAKNTAQKNSTKTKPDAKTPKTEGWATFNFWYSDSKASSLAEFKQAIKSISRQSLEHHAGHNDFSKYLGEFYDKGVAIRIEAFEKTLKGSDLRKHILAEL